MRLIKAGGHLVIFLFFYFCLDLRTLHGRKVFSCPVIDVHNLQTKHSE